MPQSHQDQHGGKDRDSHHHDHQETLSNGRQVRVEQGPPPSPQFYPSHRPDFVLPSSSHTERHTSNTPRTLMSEGIPDLDLSTDLSPASSYPQPLQVQYSSPTQLPLQANHQSHPQSVHALPSQRTETWDSNLPFPSPYHVGPPAFRIDLRTLMYACDTLLASENPLSRTVSAPAGLSAPYLLNASPQSLNASSSGLDYLTSVTSSPHPFAHNHLQQGTMAHRPHVSSTIQSRSVTPQLRPSTTPNSDASPNFSIGTLSITEANNAMQGLHWLTCDGCGANPLEGNRWKCLVCTDFDLCERCHGGNIHGHHNFELVTVQCNTHASHGNGYPAGAEASNEA
jgi:hypothetical protein